MLRSKAELLHAIESPAFTPASRDATGLVELLMEPGAGESAEKLLVRALVKLGERGRDEVIEATRRLEAETGAGVGAKAEAGTDADAGTGAETEAETETDAGTGTEAETETETDAGTEMGADGWVDLAVSGERTKAGARLLAALGGFAVRGDEEVIDELIARVGSPVERWRRAAIAALGKLGGAQDRAAAPSAALLRARAAVLARWDRGACSAAEQRALAEALGKLGGAQGQERLRALEAGADRELERRRDRALIMSQRDQRGLAESAIATTLELPPLPVRWHCRAGLGPLLADELRALGLPVTEIRREHCRATLAGPLSRAFAARLWTHLGWVFPLPSGALPQAVARALTEPAPRALLERLTEGAITWRLELGGGPRRSVVWQIVREVAAAAPALSNQPSASAWTFVVDERARTLELRPRRFVDPRFAWRQADLPAASHPTVAAAIALLAAPRGGERVWDPFTGSGSELIECALRAAMRDAAPLSLFGSDLEDAALTAAAANAERAGLTLGLQRRDAREGHLRQLDLIASNPPLGGRLRGDAGGLLCEAAPVLASALVPGGRLVWITPAPRRTSPCMERTGLSLARAFDLDLGGIRARLERWEKPKDTRAAR